jgi:hypothetical protein
MPDTNPHAKKGKRRMSLPKSDAPIAKADGATFIALGFARSVTLGISRY